ncbi:hypothetical protein A6R68_01060 [Neotoma lepida]|uniref:Spermatid nuclear transition protein 1 n=1 Tax=Neotoma lepida TaxID=56216 RepID=A0A1A6GXS1_NEOLE|nr:hypothetical protein A6R68_01060 [Neotoma lepida]
MASTSSPPPGKDLLMKTITQDHSSYREVTEAVGMLNGKPPFALSKQIHNSIVTFLLQAHPSHLATKPQEMRKNSRRNPERAGWPEEITMSTSRKLKSHGMRRGKNRAPHKGVKRGGSKRKYRKGSPKSRKRGDDVLSKYLESTDEGGHGRWGPPQIQQGEVMKWICRLDPKTSFQMAAEWLKYGCRLLSILDQ